jgi:hypothetical protein
LGRFAERNGEEKGVGCEGESEEDVYDEDEASGGFSEDSIMPNKRDNSPCGEVWDDEGG